MPPALPFLYQDFSGGLNTKDAAELLADNQARDLLNVQSNRRGAVTKRAGLVQYSAAVGGGTVGYLSLNAFDGAPGIGTVGACLLAGTTNDLFAIYVSVTGVVTTRHLTSFLFGGSPWTFVQSPQVAGQGPLFGINGPNGPLQWDGGLASVPAAWTAVTGTVPHGTMALTHNNSVFIAGDSAFPSRLYWSEPGDATNWPAANVVDFDPGDGEGITGIGIVGPYLLVGKSHKLFVVTNSSTGANRRLSDTVGIAAQRSIASGPAGTYFLSDERVYVTNGSRLDVISDPIQPTLDSIIATQKVKAAGVFFRGHYYLSYCDAGSENNKTLDWDTTLNSWWLHSIGSNEFAVGRLPATGVSFTGAPFPGRLFSAKPTGGVSGFVDQCFVPGVYTDHGNPIAWVWRGPWQSPSFFRRRRFPTPYFRKRLRQIRTMGSGTVDLSLATDFSGVEILKHADLFAGSTITVESRTHSLGVAHAFSLIFGGTSSTADELDLYVLMLVDRRDGVVG